MKNLKKLLPLFALVLGLGLVFTQSAFTDKSEKKPFITYYYILNEAGTEYTYFDDVIPQGGTCEDGPTDQCVIGFDTQHDGPLDPNDLPDVPDYTSGNDGWYNENP